LDERATEDNSAIDTGKVSIDTGKVSIDTGKVSIDNAVKGSEAVDTGKVVDEYTEEYLHSYAQE
jgi:hypothetical protein